MLFTILDRAGAGTDTGSIIKKLLIHCASFFYDILNVSFYFGNAEIKLLYFIIFSITLGVFIKLIRSVG